MRIKMQKKKTPKTKKQKESYIAALCIVIIAVCGVLIAAIYFELHKPTPFVYQEVLEEVAINVGEEEISFKDASYYIMVVETNFNATASNYNTEDNHAFWDVRMKNKYKNIGNLAKETVKNACIRDSIYYQQAIKEGYSFSEEKIEEIEQSAISEMNKMTDSQKEITEYTLQDMEEILTKIEYAKAYVTDLMNEGYTEQDLDTNGKKYKEIAKNYKVEVNNTIWQEVRIGQTTINGV